MAMITRPFGHPKARKFLKGNVIPFQMVKFQGDTVEESAMASVLAQAWEGKGPLAKLLKSEAKAMVEKFEKTNSDFKFSKFGRNRQSAKDSNVEAPKSKSAKKSSKDTKPSKKSTKKSPAKELATA